MRYVDGGKPMHINGNIVLCGRSDESAMRGYSGSLAELAIWDGTLTPAQVAAIYAAVSYIGFLGLPGAHILVLQPATECQGISHKVQTSIAGRF